MTIHLYLAPAASGKTTYAVKAARQASRGLKDEVRVCVPSRVQVRAWRRRLAHSGGALGVRVMTFDDIYTACLDASGASYTRLSKPVQHRLIWHIVRELTLFHYRPLVDRPGFVAELIEFIGDLKAARIWPQDYLNAVVDLGSPARLVELGEIYAAYQDYLHKNGWADTAGLGWLAVEILEEQAPVIALDWPLFIVDGFDDFTYVQLAMLKALTARCNQTVLTLTGEAGSAGEGETRPVFHRFNKTRRSLENELTVEAEPLPGLSETSRQQSSPPALVHLEENLFADSPSQLDPGETVTLVAAPDRKSEVRAALRWLKTCLVRDGVRPAETALLARNIAPYRPFIIHTAAEFGLPIRLVGGFPLRSNPAVVAILDLLKIFLPRSSEDPGPALDRRSVVDAWRSPYFNWALVYPSIDTLEPIGIKPADADALDQAARSGRVIGGRDQWEELFKDVAGTIKQFNNGPDQDLSGDQSDATKAALAQKFDAFVSLIAPPTGAQIYSLFVNWLETLIGREDPNLETQTLETKRSLKVVNWISSTEDPLAEADVEALREFQKVLRSLAWVEEGIGKRVRVDFKQFLTELMGAVDATTYWLPTGAGRDEIQVADIVQARGASFRSVAVLGMAEGEFPAVRVEDPFLWESDRSEMQNSHGMQIESSIESTEREFFYETITSPWDSILLTRPRLTDNGAEWPPSPYWEEIKRLLYVEATRLTTESIPVPNQSASLVELMASIAVHPASQTARSWVTDKDPERLPALRMTADIFELRYSRGWTQHNGDLTGEKHRFRQLFHRDYKWSPSSLERYRSCPFSFFVSKVMKIEPRLEPAEGLDAAQQGTIYHRILERLYQSVNAADRDDLDLLLARLPAIAKHILDEAPQREDFRETAWWRHTRAEILRNVSRSVSALAALPGQFVPVEFEAGFFGEEALTIKDGSDQIRLVGVIDRADRDPKDRLRIIDYKTSGPYSYSKQTLDRGEKLQLPLYALAARDALDLGSPVEGFYWHVKQAKPSGLTLEDYGPEEAINTAVTFAWQVVTRARQGYFVPEPPANGCPSYCPAAGFCWSYRPGMWR
jgi:ATP-dependent helicase/nuclease subunit B